MVGATARRRRARSAAIAGYVNIIARMLKAKRPVSFRERRGAPTRRARRSFWASFRRDSGSAMIRPFAPARSQFHCGLPNGSENG